MKPLGTHYEATAVEGRYMVRAADGRVLGRVERASGGWNAFVEDQNVGWDRLRDDAARRIDMHEPAPVPAAPKFGHLGYESLDPGEALMAGAALTPAWTFYVDVQDNEEHCLVVTAEADGAARGEFTFRWVDLDGQPCPCPRLEAYQDGWAALHASGLLWAMARWPEDISMTDLVGILLRRGLVIRRGIQAHG